MEEIKKAIKEVLNEQFPSKPNRVIRTYFNPAERILLYIKILFFVIIMVGAGIGLYTGNKILTEWKDLKFKEIQSTIKFKEYQNKQYQAETIIISKKELQKQIDDRVSKELAKKIKKKHEKPVSVGQAIMTRPEINTNSEIVGTPSEFHLETAYFKVDAIYNKTKKTWFSTEMMKSIPIKINWLETTSTKNKIDGIRNFYIEVTEIPENGKEIKLKSKTVQVAMLTPSEDPTKKRKTGLFKFKIFENKTMQITFTGLATYGLFKLLK